MSRKNNTSSKLRQNVLFGIVVLLAAAALVLALRPDLIRRNRTVVGGPTQSQTAKHYDDRINTPDKTFNITIKDHKLVKGPADIVVNKGDSVRINLTVLTDDEEHVVLDGYGISTEGSPIEGASGGMSFIADKTGKFEFYALDEEHEDGETFSLGHVAVR